MSRSSQSAYRYPSIRRRLASLVYELVLLGGVLFVAAVVYVALLGLAESGWRRHAFQTYLFLVMGAYYMTSWRRHGHTLPMKTWKLRLVRADGTPLGWTRALLRYLLAWPSIGLFACGIIYAVFDRERQFLHDRLAGTRLIQVDDPGARSGL